jgi:hypothetical protein
VNIVGNVFGRKNVVGKHTKDQVVSYIGIKDNEKKIKKSEKKP